MRISGLLVAAAVAALVSAPVSANPLSRILAKSGLTAQDTNVMRQAEQALLAEPRGGSGKQVRWRNPDSGAHGLVQLGSAEGGCRFLHHQAYLKDAEEPKRLRRKFCNTESGWLLSE